MLANLSCVNSETLSTQQLGTGQTVKKTTSHLLGCVHEGEIWQEAIFLSCHVALPSVVTSTDSSLVIQVAVPWLCYYEYLDNANVNMLVNELQKVFFAFFIQVYKSTKSGFMNF